MLKAELVIESNHAGALIYIANYSGAFVRGKTVEDAISKVKNELIDYIYWAKGVKINPHEDIKIEIIQIYESQLHVEDADTDVLFECETTPLTHDEYQYLKKLVLKSANDFYKLYFSCPDKHCTDMKERKTFYGSVPRTAEEIYVHTRDVNAYYFNEIGIPADNQGNIYECRKHGFELLEMQQGFLNNSINHGNYNENWTLRKMMRRFIWHDRIHAKALIKMSKRIKILNKTENTYQFQLTIDD